ncbi:MAG: DNA cytosine methyltransferase [Verrucomicrobiota bacterium]
MKITKGKIVGVDLFAGAGGMTQGAKMAGIDVAFAVEADHHAAKTYRANHPEVDLYAKDIRKLRKIPDFSRGNQTILFGGPPCQGFSTSNQRTRNRDNRNNWMFKEFVRIAKSWHPDWIVFENVKGVAETENGAFLELILKSFERIGYTLSKGILNAAKYGVPQKRERLFVIGSLHGISVPMPKPSTSKPIPVRYALADLPDLPNGANLDQLPYKYAARTNYVRLLRNGEELVVGNLVTKNADFVINRYKHVKQGGNWEDIPSALMKNYRENYECHTGIYHRLDPDKPSIVIGNYRKNMLIHPIQDRGLSVREAARIQSFPDYYKFLGTIGFQQQQVGNAVPPLLAKAVFESINSIR